MLAPVIVKQLSEQLRLVAENPEEDNKRRGEAGYQFAALIIYRLQVPTVDTYRSMLAATVPVSSSWSSSITEHHWMALYSFRP